MNMAKKNPEGIVSRRKFLSSAGLVGGAAVGSALLGGCAAQATPAPATAAPQAPAATAVPPTAAPTAVPTAVPTAEAVAAASKPVDLTVLDPTGAQEISYLFAKRLDTLEGKKICELGADKTKWQPHRTFPYIEDLLKKKYPTIKFVPFTEFSPGLGINADKIAEAVKAAGCDAAIIGNAG